MSRFSPPESELNYLLERVWSVQLGVWCGECGVGCVRGQGKEDERAKFFAESAVYLAPVSRTVRKIATY